MGLYSDRFLPWMMEIGMRTPEILEQRRAALRSASGRVLEVGFGFGGALQAYPAEASRGIRLVGLEPGVGMVRRAATNVARARIPVSIVRAGAEAMPFADRSFDTVVSTWTLCSIRDLAPALLEMRRVLRPDGAFLFLEHGRAEDPGLARRQARWNRIHGLYSGGCRLDLRIDQVILDAGFSIETIERYTGRPGPAILSQMYRGIARP